VALDRPADDRPETAKPPPSPDAPTDPHAVAHLTRAEAFASHRYWNEVTRFAAVWRDHVERWPRDRSGSQGQTSAESGHVDASAEQVARAEGGISEDIKQAASDCSRPTWLGGFEFRLKSAERIREKVAGKLEAEPDRSLAEIVRTIPDAIRYTFCFDSTNYTSGFADIKDKLEASGYEMYYTKNFWLNTEYKGVNTRWITPEGQRFEVQFHTAESFHAKQEATHLAYERIRDPGTSDHERSELQEFQREVSGWVPVPLGAQDIANYKKRGF
jgi:hypothetical protein